MGKMVPQIESCDFGRIVIDGRTYVADVIVTPDGVKPDWWRREGHSLCPQDLEGVLSPDIDVVIIGCGANGAMKIPESTRHWLSEIGKELVSLPTQAACDRYNELAGSGRVIAGLHLTC